MIKNDFPVYDIGTLSGFKQEDIMISRFFPYLQVHKNLHSAHRHNFYHLVLFTEGAGSHTIDFEHFEVKPWQIYFMIPGQVHSWNFKGHTDGYVINFSVSFINTLIIKPDYLAQFIFFTGQATHSVINIPAKNRDDVKSVMEQLLLESENHAYMGADMVRALMVQLFIMVGRMGEKQPYQTITPYNFTLLKNFQKLIEDNYTRLKLPKDYAALLYITPNHLNALCADILGLSAGELIRNRVILEAKRLLINLDLGIAEIAYRLNFADNSYFTKFFKKYTGVTPEEFRKKQINNQAS